MRLSTIFLATFTLVAFATNSLLCRQALMTDSIGPVEFTAIRLGSGLVALLPLLLFRRRPSRRIPESPNGEHSLLSLRPTNVWPSAALFGYAIFFSLAYVQLDAGVGALILFASVQISMMGLSIVGGNKVSPTEWLGLAISSSGLVYLLSPGLSAPPALGTALMIASGAAWGIYSLLGQRETQPVLSTARNFLFCFPGVVILGLIAVGNVVQVDPVPISSQGIVLAVISGAVASAVGYVLWYLTVGRVTTTVASVSQLLVPILAALGGAVFLNEKLTYRLGLASVLIIGGIVTATFGRRARQPSTARAEVQQSAAQT